MSQPMREADKKEEMFCIIIWGTHFISKAIKTYEKSLQINNLLYTTDCLIT